MTLKVFISSTIKDLGEYRQLVIDALLKMEMLPIAMEYFGSNKGKSALEADRERVMSSDVFIGIYAHRYGWIPDDNQSILELELKWAKEANIPCLLYILAPDVPWPIEWVDWKHQETLQSFKDRISEDTIVSFFRSPDDLQAKVVMGLVQIRDSIFMPTPVSVQEFFQENSIFGKPLTSKEFHCDIFMIMPFKEPFNSIYSDHIINVAQKRLKLNIRRGDDFFAGQAIMKDVWSAMYNSRLIIAECTGRNANVYYELGMAHTLNRPTILITQDITDIPFDIRHLRTITYEYTPRGMQEFENTLETAITKLI